MSVVEICELVLLRLSDCDAANTGRVDMPLYSPAIANALGEGLAWRAYLL